jgi:hypothetical protein
MSVTYMLQWRRRKPWTIEYFEQADTTQPAEVFEDAVYQAYPKLAGKLARIVVD